MNSCVAVFPLPLPIWLKGKVLEILIDSIPTYTNRHSYLDLVGGAVMKQAHQPHAFFELDSRDQIGFSPFKTGGGYVGFGIGIQDTFSGNFPPFQILFASMDANRAWLELILVRFRVVL